MAREFYNETAVHGQFSDLAELRAFARKLIAQWDAAQRKPFHMKIEYDGAGGGPILWSFTNHVVNLMRTVLDLSEQNRGIIAVPLIRLMVENTMTGVWLYLEPANIWAILTEGFQKRKTAIIGVIKSETDGFDKSDVDKIDRILETFDKAALPPFEQRCEQIEGGKPIYVIYRVLSTYCHAGMGMGDFYLKEIDEEPWLARVPDAELESHEAWLGTAVCMLLASMRLVDLIDHRGSLRAQVERAAKKMGVTLNFTKAATKGKEPKARKNHAEGQNGKQRSA